MRNSTAGTISAGAHRTLLVRIGLHTSEIPVRKRRALNFALDLGGEAAEVAHVLC